MFFRKKKKEVESIKKTISKKVKTEKTSKNKLSFFFKLSYWLAFFLIIISFFLKEKYFNIIIQIGIGFLFLSLIMFIIRSKSKRKSSVVEEIKKTLKNKNLKFYETEFDILYDILKEFKRLKVSEISQGFNISKKKAEVWCQILEGRNLAELHYPTVGHPELIIKNEKNIG